MIQLNALLGMSVALGALIAAGGVVLAGRRCRARCASLELSLDALRRELEVVASISAGTGLRVQRMEHEYSTAPAGSLQHAIELARHGADSNKIVEQFGLSPGEADLMARLHGQKRTA